MEKLIFDCPDDIINKMCVTDHASQRMKERLGIRKKAQKRQAIKAFKAGKVDIGYCTKDTMHLEYHNFIYIFSYNVEENYPVLLTVFHNKKLMD